MAWKVNDLSLGTSSAVETVQDGPVDVALAIACTPAERRQLQELFEHAGDMEEVQLGLGGRVTLDTSPNGENTFYLAVDATYAAGGMVDEGWFAASDAPDDYRGSLTHARLQLGLKRICGKDNAAAQGQATTEFLTNDF